MFGCINACAEPISLFLFLRMDLQVDLSPAQTALLAKFNQVSLDGRYTPQKLLLFLQDTCDARWAFNDDTVRRAVDPEKVTINASRFAANRYSIVRACDKALPALCEVRPEHLSKIVKAVLTAISGNHDMETLTAIWNAAMPCSSPVKNSFARIMMHVGAATSVSETPVDVDDFTLGVALHTTALFLKHKVPAESLEQFHSYVKAFCGIIASASRAMDRVASESRDSVPAPGAADDAIVERVADRIFRRMYSEPRVQGQTVSVVRADAGAAAQSESPGPSAQSPADAEGSSGSESDTETENVTAASQDGASRAEEGSGGSDGHSRPTLTETKKGIKRSRPVIFGRRKMSVDHHQHRGPSFKNVAFLREEFCLPGMHFVPGWPEKARWPTILTQLGLMSMQASALPLADPARVNRKHECSVQFDALTFEDVSQAKFDDEFPARNMETIGSAFGAACVVELPEGMFTEKEQVGKVISVRLDAPLVVVSIPVGVPDNHAPKFFGWKTERCEDDSMLIDDRFVTWINVLVHDRHVKILGQCGRHSEAWKRGLGIDVSGENKQHIHQFPLEKHEQWKNRKFTYVQTVTREAYNDVVTYCQVRRFSRNLVAAVGVLEVDCIRKTASEKPVQVACVQWSSESGFSSVTVSGGSYLVHFVEVFNRKVPTIKQAQISRTSMKKQHESYTDALKEFLRHKHIFPFITDDRHAADMKRESFSNFDGHWEARGWHLTKGFPHH